VVLKRKVRKLIEEENPRHPLTDDQLAALLQGQGIQVTRRTVAKYREDMHILLPTSDADARREFQRDLIALPRCLLRYYACVSGKPAGIQAYLPFIHFHFGLA